MRTLTLVLALLPLMSCDAPGPLKAERDDGTLFAPSEAGTAVVEAVLIVGEALPPVRLRQTVAPGEMYEVAATALTGAEVAIRSDGQAYAYAADPDSPGQYLPPAGAPVVAPATSYELVAVTGDAAAVRAETRTPPRMRIDAVVLLDDEQVDGEYREAGELRLAASPDEMYGAAENQLEYTRVIMEVHLESGGEAPAYQFGVRNLELNSPLLIDSEWLEDEDLERRETSPLLRAGDDGEIYLPWDGIYYAGRHLVKLYAVDENWFDLVRTDNLDVEREAGEAGQGFQRPLFHVENGIGLFASACVDSFGFFVRAKGEAPCSGCECWGCADSHWEGDLGLSGEGSLRFVKEVTSGANCDLTYAISGATTVTPCASCSFGWAFTLGVPEVAADNGGCGYASQLAGYSLRFAQGTEIVGEVDGETTYSLYTWDEDGESAPGWQQVDGGWSMVPAEGRRAGRWQFELPGE